MKKNDCPAMVKSGNLLIKYLLIMKLFIFLILLTSFQALAFNSSSQERINLNLKSKSIIYVIKNIETDYNYRFVYSDSVALNRQRVDVYAKNATIDYVMQQLLQNTSFSYRKFKEGLIVVIGKDIGDVTLPVKGTIKDDKGSALPGVSIFEKGTTNGTVSDENGNFSINVKDEDAVLVISNVGFQPKEISIQGKTNFEIVLIPIESKLDEVVVVGYGTQKKGALTGAVSSISSKDIVTTKNENVQNMLTGKVSGVRVVQRTAEPGDFNNTFDIRGFGAPLVIIDGVPRTNADFQRLNSNDIDNISVLKDASAAIYGVRSANGVVLITTKRGKNNESILSYDGNFTWQFPSGFPKTVDIYDYMTLRNEAAMHNVNGGAPVYSDQMFEDYRSGKLQSTDWYPLVFAKFAPETQHNLSATGGNDKIQYYFGGGYFYQGSFFKTNDLNYNKYNLRSSITAKIAKQFTLDVNVNLVTETINQPYQGAWWAIRSFWRQGPQIPAYANNDPTKPFYGLIEGDNPVVFMDKDLVGYRVMKNSWIQPAVTLRYDFPFIKGLYAKTMFSYDYNLFNRNYFQKQYQEYRYDDATKTYTSYTRQSPDRITRQAYFNSQILSQTSLNYSRTFSLIHKVEGTLIWEAQKREGDNFAAQRDLALPLPYLFAGLPLNQVGNMSVADLYEGSNLGLAGRFNYAYNAKYLAEFLFRYDGSSKFQKGYQWGFFPGGSIGWRISEEKFIKNSSSLSFIDQLKLRASYGVTGDDGASSYQWASGYNYPSGTDSRNFTGGYVFDGNFIASANSIGISNPNITWYTSKTLNLGVDFVGWKGLLGITAEYFRRKRDGLLAYRNGGIPTVVGAALPQENLNSDMNYGYEVELSHNNNIGQLAYSLKGLFSFTRIKALYVERGPNGSSYRNWRDNQNDRLQNIWWGLTSNGRYQTWDDIWNSSVYVGRNALPGDYRYEDWNGDGEINDLDVHPYQLSSTPWINYGFSASFSYKGVDMFFLIQGAALSTVQYTEQLYQPLWGNSESGAMQQFMDRWHPADPHADPYDPKTVWIPGHYAYTGSLPDVNSSYNSVNGAYARLKTIELGYTLPTSLGKKVGVKNARIYVNGYNLLTLTKVKYIDPEHPNDTWGYLYPLNKTVSAGVSLTF